MHIGLVKAGRIVKCGSQTGKFLRMSGQDALIELSNGKRVMWSGYVDVQILSDEEEIEDNILPRLEAELARLDAFTEGAYAKLGVEVFTPCIEVHKSLHEPLIAAALGMRPEGAIVCRRCTTKLCVRIDHLFWGTRSDCQRDMCLRGVAKPCGKQVTAVTIAAQMVKLRLRIMRLRQRLIS